MLENCSWDFRLGLPMINAEEVLELKGYKQHEREEEDMCESVLTLGEAGDAR